MNTKYEDTLYVQNARFIPKNIIINILFHYEVMNNFVFYMFISFKYHKKLRQEDIL